MLAQQIRSNEDTERRLAEVELLLFEICENAINNGGWLDPVIANAIMVFLSPISANAIPQATSAAFGGEHGNNI